MKIIVHTARIKLNSVEQIIMASLTKDDVLKEVKVWKEKYPARKIRYETIVEEVERP